MEGRSTAPSKSQITALLVAALVLGGSGLGLGAYSLVSGGQGAQGPKGEQGVQGTQGDQGTTGLQGPAGMVGPVVSITQPGNNTVISGIVSVRIMLWNSTRCTFEVLVNGSLNATELPWQWNTNAPQFGNGWWNLTVRAINASLYAAQDQLLVFIDTTPYTGQVIQVKTAINTVQDNADPNTPTTKMTISIDVTEGSFIWCSTSAALGLIGADFSGSACGFRILLDSVTVITGGSIYATSTSGTINVFERVSLQGLSAALSAGSHVVEFQYYRHEDFPSANLIFNWDETNSTLTVMEIGG
jgi:hypothetical protein